ncbi:type II secretion system protein GspJ [Methylomarinum vadi]|uniref:type II secretion system protein GspJ n=1 Tax=Methylomarinum vadi TaxID=438855 RepID=UPI0004DF1617|nr:type II secretion system protein GspJ [Methylomarinum vadi]
MRKSYTKGFSLLELLVVITISSALIIFLSQLHRMVGHAAQTLFSNNDDWLFERFARKQFWHLDSNLLTSELTHWHRDEIIFVSRYSARYALDGPPALVRYHLDDSKNAIVYTETLLPPWWDGQLERFRHRDLFQASEGQWQSNALTQVEDFSFSFFNGTRWGDTWDSGEQLPALVKMQFSKGGMHTELVLETKALSFSIPSGS